MESRKPRNCAMVFCHQCLRAGAWRLGSGLGRDHLVPFFGVGEFPWRDCSRVDAMGWSEPTPHLDPLSPAQGEGIVRQVGLAWLGSALFGGNWHYLFAFKWIGWKRGGARWQASLSGSEWI